MKSVRTLNPPATFVLLHHYNSSHICDGVIMYAVMVSMCPVLGWSRASNRPEVGKRFRALCTKTPGEYLSHKTVSQSPPAKASQFVRVEHLSIA